MKLDQAAIKTAKLNLAYSHIIAPVAGRVGLRLVDPGNYITGSSSTGIAVVTTIKPTTVEFTVAQNDLAKVSERFRTAGVKLPVTAYTSDNSKKLATGTLYAINNQMTMSTGTVTLRAMFPNDDEALSPNEFVNVQLLVDTLHQAVLVPTSAVLTGAPGNYVYLVNKNDTVSVHKVTLGPSDGKNTVILSGLNIGDSVVTEGTDRLSDGARINGRRDASATEISGFGSAVAGKKDRRRRRVALGADTAVAIDERLPAVHRQAGGDGSSDDCSRACRPRLGGLPARLVLARRRLPDDPGAHILSGREPAGDVDHGDGAA